jgi:hypothetical protein
MTFSTSAKPLGYYVGGDQLFEQLQDRYGCYFESMERHWKLIFRASLCRLSGDAPHLGRRG